MLLPLVENSSQESPVAVGGVGGSGTRVVAEIIKKIGFYIGSDLNPSNDNLWFTLLMKRPSWFIKNFEQNESVIYKGISIFEKLMTHRALSSGEIIFILQAGIDIAVRGHDHLHSGRGMWAFKRLFNMLRNRKSNFSPNIVWGWKEPNTHIFIKYLATYFKQMKYIHVIRHGLDMAYSNNQAQLFNWGKLFGVDPDSIMTLPQKSLRYWIRANRQAIILGHRLLGSRFYLLNFDRLCDNPASEVDYLLDFIGIKKKNIDIKDIISLIRTPVSSGRYKKYDISVFTAEDISAVREMGFEIHQT